MSVFTHPLPHHSLLDRLRAGLSQVFAALVWLGETGPRAQAVRKLNGESDESLAARGTSREAEVNRIFAGRFY